MDGKRGMWLLLMVLVPHNFTAIPSPFVYVFHSIFAPLLAAHCLLLTTLPTNPASLARQRAHFPAMFARGSARRSGQGCLSTLARQRLLCQSNLLRMVASAERCSATCLMPLCASPPIYKSRAGSVDRKHSRLNPLGSLRHCSYPCWCGWALLCSHRHVLPRRPGDDCHIVNQKELDNRHRLFALHSWLYITTCFRASFPLVLACMWLLCPDASHRACSSAASATHMARHRST